MFEFEYPYVFLIVFVFIACKFFCKGKAAYMYMPGFINHSLHVKKDYLSEILKWLCIVLLITALASPVGKIPFSQTKPAHGVMLLMDVSDSMSQGRMAVNSIGSYSTKLNVAKVIASEYVEQRSNDHVGLIVFGDFAYVASPLSFDHKSSADILQRMQMGMAGRKTAMYDALFLSARLLKKSPAKEKIVILLTDGVNTSGQVPFNAALRAIEDEKIRVFTIGVGRRGDFDERVLKEIANKSGGEFFMAGDASALKSVYEHIDRLQKSNLKQKSNYDKEYLYMYPLAGAIVFLFLYVVYRRRV